MRNSIAVILIIAMVSLGQTGGTYDLSSAVIAGGGGTSSGGTFVVSGTSGQAIAGTQSVGGQYALSGGFWTDVDLIPTAANVTIRGSIRTANGAGVRNVIVTLRGATGPPRHAVTTTFGYYRFDGVAVGQSYIVEVVGKRYRFPGSPMLISPNDEMNNVDFIAEL